MKQGLGARGLRLPSFPFLGNPQAERDERHISLLIRRATITFMQCVRMPVRSYRDLIAWQKSIDFVTEIYRCTRTFPKEETYGLMSQLRRAAVSVPSNIAEGHARLTTGEFRQFLGQSLGSLTEIESQIQIAIAWAMSVEKTRTGCSSTPLKLEKLCAAYCNRCQSKNRGSQPLDPSL